MAISFRPALLVACVAVVLACLSGALPGAPDAVAEVTANAAGRYDSLVLRDLGGKQATLVQLVAANGAYTARRHEARVCRRGP